MRLENDKIVIESRAEIDELQEMIENYIKNCNPKSASVENLKKIQNQLDALYISW